MADFLAGWDKRIADRRESDVPRTIGAPEVCHLAAAGVGYDVQQRLFRRQASAQQRTTKAMEFFRFPN